MNITNDPVSLPLLTLDSVRERMNSSIVTETRAEHINSIIEQVSAEFARYLGAHLLAEARTETYKLRRFQKTITLTGVPISAVTSLKVAETPGDFASQSSLVENTDFVIGKPTGTITLLVAQPYSPGFVQVAYTGGYFTGSGELGTKHQWLTAAAEVQVIYRLQRQDSLGGNVQTISGQGTTFERPYGLHPDVYRTLHARRRTF